VVSAVRPFRQAVNAADEIDKRRPKAEAERGGSELGSSALTRLNRHCALAWVLRNPSVSAPIVGATKPHHLTEAVAALDIDLTKDEADALERPYIEYGPSWY
jgi:aryl-alcohol dehydrogenase-like predicted oxidoreductase